MSNSAYTSPLSKEGPVLLTSSLVSDSKDNIMMELLQQLKSLLTNIHHSIRKGFVLFPLSIFNILISSL